LIRRAGQADIDAVVDMGERFYATTKYAEWAPFCRDSSRQLVQRLVDSGVVLLSERDGSADGMVGVFVAPFMFCHDVLCAHEVFWWVEPSSRGGLTAWRLLQRLEQECAAAGCSAIQMLSLATSPGHADKLYERAGYDRTEKAFTKILRSR
jgi:GNAT superfamily N-acetyltransferase